MTKAISKVSTRRRSASSSPTKQLPHNPGWYARAQPVLFEFSHVIPALLAPGSPADESVELRPDAFFYHLLVTLTLGYQVFPVLTLGYQSARPLTLTYQSARPLTLTYQSERALTPPYEVLTFFYHAPMQAVP